MDPDRIFPNIERYLEDDQRIATPARRAIEVLTQLLKQTPPKDQGGISSEVREISEQVLTLLKGISFRFKLLAAEEINQFYDVLSNRFDIPNRLDILIILVSASIFIVDNCRLVVGFMLKYESVFSFASRGKYGVFIPANKSDLDFDDRASCRRISRNVGKPDFRKNMEKYQNVKDVRETSERRQLLSKKAREQCSYTKVDEEEAAREAESLLNEEKGTRKQKNVDRKKFCQIENSKGFQ